MLRCVIFTISLFIASWAYSQPITESLLDEENALIVEMEFARSVYSDYIELYEYESGYLVPLSAIVKFLDFPIVIDTEASQVKGWFINEVNTLFIDAKRQSFVLRGEVQPYPKTLIMSNDNDIYLESKLFERIFNIELNLNYSALTLTIIPKQKLPIQLQYERQQKQTLFKKQKEGAPSYKTVRSKYSLVSMPKIDATIGYEYNELVSRNNNVDYSLVSRGDIGYVTHNLAASGATNDSLNSLRLSLGRNDIERKNFGISELYVGDVNEVPNFLSSSQGLARGVRVSTFDASTPSQFDTTNFEGDAQPGWDIELYRNGSLIDFLTVGDDARYEFNDVELFYGNNNFKIISYGPQGQIREANETVRIDSNFIKQNDFRYRFSITDRNKTLFGIDEDDTIFSHKDGPKIAANARYGLTQNINLEALHTHIPLADGRSHDFHGLGVYSSVGNALVQLNSIYNSRNQSHANSLGINASVGKVSGRFSQTIFSNYFSETEAEEGGDIKRYETSLDIDSQLNLPKKLPNLNIGAGLSLEEFEDGVSQMRGSNRLSTNIAGFGLTNSMNWSSLKRNNDTIESADGTFSIRQRLRKSLIRFSTQYDLIDTKDFTDIDASFQYTLNKKSNVAASLNHDLQGGNNTNYLLSYNHNLGFATFSTFAEYTDEKDYRFGTNLAFSLSKHPQKTAPYVTNYNSSNNGDLLLQSFDDANNNFIHDKDEILFKDVKYIVRGGRLNDIGDPETKYVTNVSSLRATQVEVDTASFDDPYMAPSEYGFNIIAHPASLTTIKFPIVRVAEIEGMMFISNGTKSRGAPSVRLALIDSEGQVAYKTRSEFDGFFLFDQVKMGTYRLKVDKRDTDSVNAKEVLSEEIFVDGSEDIIQLDDITIIRNSTLNQASESMDLPDGIKNQAIVVTETSNEMPLTPLTEDDFHSILSNLPVVNVELPKNNVAKARELKAKGKATSLGYIENDINVPKALVIAPTQKTLPQKRYASRGK